MATIIDTLETVYKANIIDMERAAKKLNKLHDKFAADVNKAHTKAANDTAKVWQNAKFGDAMKNQAAQVDNLKRSLLAAAPALAALFSGQQAIAAADSWTRFSNSLKVAGLEGGNLATVQNALFESAQKNGVALEPLAQLYGRASQSAKELGASQADLLKFTNGVTAALRVQGGDAASASGALMQLSQALSAGTVRAEEFNSINEGARPILEAVAAGNEKFGGSVAKLRQYMLDGKLTSQELFESFNRGSAMLEAKAAKAPLTVAASLNLLTNAMAKYIGQSDSALSASERLSLGISGVAENLDTLVLALTVVGGAITGKMIAPLIQARVMTGLATVENLRYQASLASMAVAQGTLAASTVRATAAMGALRAGMSFLGGGWTIAITAIGAALGYLAIKSLEAKKESASLEDTLSDVENAMEATEWAAKAATVATKEFGDKNDAARKLAEALTGKLGDVADKYYEVAAAAKTAAMNQLMAANVGLQGEIDKARGEVEAKRNERRRVVRGPIGEPGARAAAAGQAAIGIDPGMTAQAAEQTAKLNGLLKQQADLQKRIQEVSATPLMHEEWLRGMPSSTSGAGNSKGKSGPSAAELTARREELDLQMKLDVARARGDKAQIDALERQVELRRLIEALENAGLKNADARLAAEAQLVAKDYARLQFLRENPTITAAKSPDFNPDGFISTNDRNAAINDTINNNQDELREGFANAFRGGLEAGMRDGLPGVMDYFGQMLRQKVIDNFVNQIADSLFPKGGVPGGGPWGAIMNFGAKLFGHAGGTRSSVGGWHITGENGPELVNMRPGAAVTRARIPHIRAVSALIA
jgi:tape measure domain-containing protein